MPSSVLVHLAFQVHKNFNEISRKTLLIRNALCLLYKIINEIAIDIKRDCHMNSEII